MASMLHHFNGEDNEHWQLHAHFIRRCCVQLQYVNLWWAMKCRFESQRDLTAEQGRKIYVALSEVHYKEVSNNFLEV